jgi:hypothetical protein
VQLGKWHQQIYGLVGGVFTSRLLSATALQPCSSCVVMLSPSIPCMLLGRAVLCNAVLSIVAVWLLFKCGVTLCYVLLFILRLSALLCAMLWGALACL